MREVIRDELYGNLIYRTALKAAADYRVVNEDTAYQPFHDAWNDRYLKDKNGREGWRVSKWGHNLDHMSGDWFAFMQSVRGEYAWPAMRACWILVDLAAVAMFGPIGNNYDEPSLEEV